VITGGSGPPLQLVHAGYCFYPKPKKDDSLLVLDISLGAAEDTGAVCRSTGIALVLVYSISGLELYSGVICYHFEYGFETVRNGPPLSNTLLCATRCLICESPRRLVDCGEDSLRRWIEPRCKRAHAQESRSCVRRVYSMLEAFLNG